MNNDEFFDKTVDLLTDDAQNMANEFMRILLSHPLVQLEGLSQNCKSVIWKLAFAAMAQLVICTRTLEGLAYNEEFARSGSKLVQEMRSASAGALSLQERTVKGLVSYVMRSASNV